MYLENISNGEDRKLNHSARGHRARYLGTALYLLTASIANVVYAQDAAEDVAEDEKVEQVVVTGSRITNSVLTSAIPLQKFSLEEIQSAGTLDVGEILEDIPGVFLGTSPSNSLLSTQNAGLSTVSLRNLGSDRTLTLINGRRAVSNSGSGQRIDTGTIPSGFLDSIEVITGGASAIYGADAVAGVANIKFKESFEGFRLTLRGEDTAEGGREEQSIDTTWGINFGDGRGNFMLGGVYEDRAALFGRDRDFATFDQEIDITTGEFELNRSSSLPGGRFDGGDAWNIDGVWQNDQVGSQYCLDDGRVPACDDYQEAIDGFRFRPEGQLFPSRRRGSVISKASWEFNDDLKLWSQIQYSTLTTKSQRAARTVVDSNEYGPVGNTIEIGELPPDHPFIHPAVAETFDDDELDWRRRFNEVGQRFRESDRDTLRTSLGLKGSFNDDWSWDLYAGYGKHEQSQIRQNEINRQNVDFALDLEPDPDNPGGFRCLDPDARAAGCIPLNLFLGEGLLSEDPADSVAVANYIRATDRLEQELEQTTFSATINGKWLELPAGRVETAFGVDYREESQETIGDPATQAGLTTTGFIPNIKGEFDVTEIFAEFNVPLVHDAPFVDALDASVAYRSAEYSTIGNVASWNLGLNYVISEDIRFRGALSRSQRAPNITDLFSPLRSDFDDVNDPCDKVTLTTASVVADNCRSIPAVLAAIQEATDDPANMDNAFDQDGNGVFAPNVGNTELKEETADTTTFGFVLTPRFLEGFSFIADYYKIDIKDAISSVNTQDVVDLCFGDVSFNNRFCDVIERDADGQLSLITNKEENINDVVSEGIDVTTEYSFEVPNIGEFEAKLRYSHVLTLEDRFPGPDGVVVTVDAGEVGAPIDEYRFTLKWEPIENLTIRYSADYTGTVRDDNNPDPDDLLGETKFAQVIIHDAYIAYTIENDHRYRLFAGIENIEDNHGPFLPRGFNYGESSNVGEDYDSVGRRFYAGISFRW